eukprot:gene13549-biopygen4844
MRLYHCTAGSVAASSAQAKACIGNELAKVNGKPARTGKEFGTVIEGLDAIGLQFRHTPESAVDGQAQGPLPLLVDPAVTRGEHPRAAFGAQRLWAHSAHACTSMRKCAHKR